MLSCTSLAKAKATDSDGNKAGRWSKNESGMLQRAVDIYTADRQWTQVSIFLAKNGVNRGPTQCRHRWNKTQKPNLRKGTWDDSEDNVLRAEVKKSLALCGSVGKINWQVLANTVLPSRTGKACWERWIFRLDPSIDRSPFTTELDSELLRLHGELGNKWAAIAKRMSKGVSISNGTRTADQIKSRFISLQRVHKRTNSSSMSPKSRRPPLILSAAHQQIAPPEIVKRERSTSLHLVHPRPQRTRPSSSGGSADSMVNQMDYTVQRERDTVYEKESLVHAKDAEEHDLTDLSGGNSAMDTLLGSMLGEMSISVEPPAVDAEAAHAHAVGTVAGRSDDTSVLLDLALLDNFLAADLCSEFEQHEATSSSTAGDSGVLGATLTCRTSTRAGNAQRLHDTTPLIIERQDEAELIESVESQLDRIFGSCSDGSDLQPEASTYRTSAPQQQQQQQQQRFHQQHCAADMRYTSLSSLLELSM